MGLGYQLEYPRAKGQLLCSDTTAHLNGCGKNNTENLQEHGISNVVQLKSQTDAVMHAMQTLLLMNYLISRRKHKPALTLILLNW